MNEDLTKLIHDCQTGVAFRVLSLELNKDVAKKFTKMKANPIQFNCQLFETDWEDLGVHALPIEIRILAVKNCKQNGIRIIGRQGANLYVYTYGN